MRLSVFNITVTGIIAPNKASQIYHHKMLSLYCDCLIMDNVFVQTEQKKYNRMKIDAYCIPACRILSDMTVLEKGLPHAKKTLHHVMLESWLFVCSDVGQAPVQWACCCSTGHIQALQLQIIMIIIKFPKWPFLFSLYCLWDCAWEGIAQEKQHLPFLPLNDRKAGWLIQQEK